MNGEHNRIYANKRIGLWHVVNDNIAARAYAGAFRAVGELLRDAGGDEVEGIEVEHAKRSWIIERINSNNKQTVISYPKTLSRSHQIGYTT